LKFDDSSHQTDHKYTCSFKKQQVISEKKNEYNKFNLNSNIRERYQKFKADLNLVKRNLLKPISEQERTNSSDSFNYIIVNKRILSQIKDQVENEKNSGIIINNEICKIILFKLVSQINQNDSGKNQFIIVISKKDLVKENDTKENFKNLKNDQASKTNSGKKLNITPLSLDRTNDEEISNSNQNEALNIRSEKEVNFKASEFNIDNNSHIAENNIKDINEKEFINYHDLLLPKKLIEEKKKNKPSNKKRIHRNLSDKKSKIVKFKCYDIYNEGKYSPLLEKNKLSKIEETINSVDNSLFFNDGNVTNDRDKYPHFNQNIIDTLLPSKNIEDVSLKISDETNDKPKDQEKIKSISNIPINDNVYENINSVRNKNEDIYVYSMNSNFQDKEIINGNSFTKREETIHNEILDGNEFSSSIKSIEENKTNEFHPFDNEIVQENEETEKVDPTPDLNKEVDVYLNVNSNFYKDQNKLINKITGINEISNNDTENYLISPLENNEKIPLFEDTLVKNKEEMFTQNKKNCFEIEENNSELLVNTEKELLNPDTNGNEYIISDEGKNKTSVYNHNDPNKYEELNEFDNELENILPSDSEESKKIEYVESIDDQKRNGFFHNFIEEHFDIKQVNPYINIPYLEQEKEKSLHNSDDQDFNIIVTDKEEKESIINQTIFPTQLEEIKKEFINNNIYCDYLNDHINFPLIQEENPLLQAQKISQDNDTLKMNQEKNNLNNKEENDKKALESFINQRPLEIENNVESSLEKDKENVFINYKDILNTENVYDEHLKTPLKVVKNIAEQTQEYEGYKIPLNLDSLIKKFELLTNGERDIAPTNPFKEDNLEESQMKVTNLRENFEENNEIDYETLSNSNFLKENDFNKKEKEKIIENNKLNDDLISEVKELILYKNSSNIDSKAKHESKDFFEDNNKISSHYQLTNSNLPETIEGDKTVLDDKYEEVLQMSDTIKEEINEKYSCKDPSHDVIDKPFEEPDKNVKENLEENPKIIYINLKYLRKRFNNEIVYKNIKCESVKIEFLLDKQRKNLKVKE